MRHYTGEFNGWADVQQAFARTDPEPATVFARCWIEGPVRIAQVFIPDGDAVALLQGSELTGWEETAVLVKDSPERIAEKEARRAPIQKGTSLRRFTRDEMRTLFGHDEVLMGWLEG